MLTSLNVAANGMSASQRRLNEIAVRLATGKKINTGRDNPAGLIAAKQLAAETARNDQGVANMQRAGAVAATADAALGELQPMLRDLRTAVQAGANAFTDAERDAYQLEVDQLVERIDNVVNTTSFNGQPLLRDSDADGEINLSFTAVESGDAELSFDAVAASDLGTTDATLRDLTSGGSHSLSSGNFTEAFEAVDAAVNQVAVAQATVGSFQANTAEALENVAAVAAENAAAARSSIEDADFAKESADMMLEENRFRALAALTRQTNSLQRESLLTLLNPAA